MRHDTHLVSVLLLATLSLAGCSIPSPAPNPQESPAAASSHPASLAQPPATAAPATTQPAPSAETDQAIAANLGDPAKFHQLFTSLQQAVQQHDTATVAALVSYPIDINPHTRKFLHIRTPEAFIAQYDAIVTAHIADVVTTQKYSDLFVNYRGAMFGSGEVWIAGICRDKACTQTDIRVSTIQNTDGGK